MIKLFFLCVRPQFFLKKGFFVAKFDMYVCFFVIKGVLFVVCPRHSIYVCTTYAQYIRMYILRPKHYLILLRKLG